MAQAAPTVNPQSLLLRPSNFDAEEWESWMQWNGAAESLSPQTPAAQSAVSLSCQSAEASTGSISPSDPETPSSFQFVPVYGLSPTKPPKTDARSTVARPVNDKKRKSVSSATSDDQQPKTRQPRGQKVSHNIIEKKYRSKLNDKIAKLRDSVPSLRKAHQASAKFGKDVASESDGSGDDKGTASGLKFNKATVLTKATEYIEQLEKMNQRMAAENLSLRLRLKGMDRLQDSGPVHERSGGASSSVCNHTGEIEGRCPKTDRTAETESGQEPVVGTIKVTDDIRRLREQPPSQAHHTPDSSRPDGCSGPNAQDIFNLDNVRGMIGLPPDMQRLRVPLSEQAHYAPEPWRTPEDDYILEDEHGTRWRWPCGRTAGRVLMGSLAGLMLMEGFNEKEQKSDGVQRRGLFALPSELLTESRGFRAQIRQRIISFAYSPQGRKALPALVLVAVVLAVLLVLLFYLSQNEPKLAPKRSSAVVLTRPASPSVSGGGGGRVQASRMGDSPPPTTRAGRDTDEVGVRDFFARGAIGLLGYSWPFRRGSEGDEEVSEVEHFHRRWRTLSQSLPKLLYERDGG